VNNDLTIYAKEEAVSAVLLAYQKANLSIYVTAIYDNCELGGSVAPTGSFTIQRTEGNQIVNDNIDYITLRYRMGINNSPVIGTKGTDCTLSFSGKFRTTVVPHVDVISISLLDEPAHQITFPYLDLPKMEDQEVVEVKKEVPKKVTNIKKKKSFLRLVK